jgi:hypothetical protein
MRPQLSKRSVTFRRPRPSLTAVTVRLYRDPSRGAVAQLGEHKAGSLGVRGSNPLSSTNFPATSVAPASWSSRDANMCRRSWNRMRRRPPFAKIRWNTRRSKSGHPRCRRPIGGPDPSRGVESPELLPKLARHFDAADAIILRQLDASTVGDTPADINEAADEIEVAPLKSDELAEPKAGAERAQQHRVVPRKVPRRGSALPPQP